MVFLLTSWFRIQCVESERFCIASDEKRPSHS